MHPTRASLQGRPWTAIELDAKPTGRPVVTALYGWTATPGAVASATYAQVSRWAARRDASDRELTNDRLDVDLTAMLRGYGRARAMG